MGKSWDNFTLLMWKNYQLQRRKPMQTLMDLVCPVVFCLILVFLRSRVDPEDKPQHTFEPFCPLTDPNLCPESGNDTGGSGGTQFTANLSLVYSPSTNQELNSTMEIINTWLGGRVVEGLADAKTLQHYFVSGRGAETLAGIEFDDSVANAPTLPKNVHISLRFPAELKKSKDAKDWHTDLIYPAEQTPGPREADSKTGASPNYFMEGFLSLQTLIALVLILSKKGIANSADLQAKINAGEMKLPILKMQRYPHANWIEDTLLPNLRAMVAIMIMMSFMFPFSHMIRMITAEKEKQLKEALKIMGLANWLHWTAWFCKSFIFLFISVVLMVILLKVSWYPHTDYSVLTFTNTFVLLLFLVLCICATITFGFAVSVFFSKASTASTFASLFCFLSYAPYMFVQPQYHTLSLSKKLAMSLLSNSAMGLGFHIMILFEGTGDGIQWGTIFTSNTPDDGLTLGSIMVMLVIDTILYMLVALYIEAVFPGEYGVPLPWYFPLAKLCYCRRSTAIGVDEFGALPRSASKTEFFEREPINLHAGVQIRDLCKSFGKKTVVRHLSLNMYDGQITVLLGHNGAGKTTTMLMLTGMFPPTTGTALVNDNDIRTNMDGVRSSLGLCPQHNILFDELTVREHLYFFSKLKGLRGAEIETEIKTYVVLLELEDKEKAKSSTLSGGMKRKLCVGMALCGNSKVVMLDEPTAGMDPSARRALWDLLQQQKIGRTMLLTTHFMDEADLLGDRIAIMAGGELQCCGSSFFLKKKYGAGYQLIIEKTRECNPDKVTEILRKHIPNIEMHSNVGSELTYILLESQVSVFEKMLRDLENYSAAVGVRSYGISLTTLEEVFMKVGAEHVEEGDSSYPNVRVETPALLTGCSLIMNQFLAMLMKRVLSIWRSWILLLTQILLPVVFLILVMIGTRTGQDSGNLPSLKLTLDSYQEPITLIDDTYRSSKSSLFDKFVEVVQENGHKYEISHQIEKDLLKLTKSSPSTARSQYIVGASFLPPPQPESTAAPSLTLITWFNNDPYHSPGLALALTLRALYKSMLGDDYDLVFHNKPLPFTADTKVQQMKQSVHSMGFLIGFNLSFAMALVSAFYVLFYVRERACKSKHLQFVSGVQVYVFWLTSLLCDLFTYLVTVAAILITLAAFQEKGFGTADELWRLFVILMYFGCAAIPLQYWLSLVCAVPASAFSRSMAIGMGTGSCLLIVIILLHMPAFGMKKLATSAHLVFLIFPHYSLAAGIYDCYNTFMIEELCAGAVNSCLHHMKNLDEDACRSFVCHNSPLDSIRDYCCVKNQEYFKWEYPGIGKNLVISFATGLILFLLLLMYEYKALSFLSNPFAPKKRKPKVVPNEDNDVLEEKLRIQNTPESTLHAENIVVLKELTKYYKKFLAVNGISLAIKQYECFGLLGVNGAGKTTTFQMMTGDVKMSYGNAWVKGYSLRTDLKEVQKHISYCPQFDALLNDLTAKETLIMFALLRGVPFQDCRHMADKLAKDFDFHRHLNKKVKQLSGGNKRKLSTALSIVGDPAVIYLDEPTTGMDPATKRYLWNAVCHVRDAGKCVVLTSHSMEECEAMCTRLAIMVNGSFKCLGSTQHLKNKFAEGYTLMIKIKKDEGSGIADTKHIETFIQKNFPSAIKREKHQEMMTYYIPDKRIPCSTMFGVLEFGKKVLNIEDYSLGQSSLEQVFLTFTKHQVET